MTREQAFLLREYIKMGATLLSDDDALKAMPLFAHYQVGKAYAVNARFTHDGKLYKVVQAHTSQEDWVPGTVPALYVEIAPPDVIPVWVQPTGAHDAYQIGDKVHFPTKSDPVYESVIANNAWSPAVYPAGWKLAE